LALGTVIISIGPLTSKPGGKMGMAMATPLA